MRNQVGLERKELKQVQRKVSCTLQVRDGKKLGDHGSRRKIVRLDFDEFQLEHDYGSCCGDYVEVRERKKSYRQ